MFSIKIILENGLKIKLVHINMIKNGRILSKWVPTEILNRSKLRTGLEYV